MGNADTLDPHTIIGPYRLVEPIADGTGGTAQVYRARREGATGDEREVVLKIAHSSRGSGSESDEFFNQLAGEALHNEVEVLRKLRNPFIVKIHSIPWGDKLYPYMARARNVPGEAWFCALEY